MMNREEESNESAAKGGNASDQNAHQRADSNQRGFAYQRSPTAGGGGIRKPTRFIQRNESQDRPKDGASQAAAAASMGNSGQTLGGRPSMTMTKDNSMPPLPTASLASGLDVTNGSLPSVEEVTPRQLESAANYRPQRDESLLTTPSASEKKSGFNSLLSDEEASSFEPSGKKSITQSGRKAHTRSSVASVVAAQKDNVKVVIRVRPINDREKGTGSLEKVKLCLAVERNQKVLLDRGMDQKTFTFDYVATQESEQHELFEKIAKPIADSCLQGYNGTIFAYGQTGSGKTFTIQGPTMQINGEETLIGASNTNNAMHEKRGIMQRSFEYMFDCMEAQKMEAAKQGIEMQFLVKSSYLEIYNEQIMDLLDTQSYNLHVREDIKKGVYVEGLNEETVSDVKDMMNLTTRGARNRHVGSTLMNKESSRSHSVLTTIIESKTMNEEGSWQMKSSRFHIIDLAGSERSKNTKAQGERLKEAGMINKSLTALGIVINSLVEISEGKNRHVHYRDSKLTFLLRDSLGGNSKTVIIANVTAAAISVGETLSTLKFAQRAKMIKNKAVINEESSSTIALLKQELRRTKKDLAEQTNLLKISNEQLDEQTNLLKIANEQLEELQERKPGTSNDELGRLNKKENDNDGADVSLHFVDTSGLFHSHGGAFTPRGTPAYGADDSMLDEKTPGGSSMIGLQNNPKAFKLYKQRAIELEKMKERVSKVEKLLSENLESMEIQQRQYEQEIATLTKSNKDKQTALEASEKNRARDKMIIKFREERIGELENRLSNAESQSQTDTTVTSSSDNYEAYESLSKQLEDAKKEISQWVEVADKNPQAAKLFAEKQDLLAAKQALQNELGVTPESLTARIRGLNELTSNLNAYLKEYCMSEGFDQLKKKLELSNQELTTKLEALESEKEESQGINAEKVRNLQDDHEIKVAALSEKLEQLKDTFESEKLKIENTAKDQMDQLKKDLDATLAEKGELQKEIFDKVAAHEKQTQMQKTIDSLNKTLEELEQVKVALEASLAQERGEKDKTAERLRQAENSHEESMNRLQEQMETEKEQLNQSLKEVSQKANQEIQDLETEIATMREENSMKEEQMTDMQRKLREVQEENDSLQKNVLETNEEIQEKRRHVREIETKLNNTIRDAQAKQEQIQEANTALEKSKQVESDQSAQLTELTSSLERAKAESTAQIESLNQRVSALSVEREEQVAKVTAASLTISKLEQAEQILNGKVAMTEGKVEECARYEVEIQVLTKKITVFEQQIEQLQSQLADTVKDKSSTVEQFEETKVQVVAMEELTVSLTKQGQDKDSEISSLRASVTEKDLELAKTLREIDDSKAQLKQSLVEEQDRVNQLRQEVSTLNTSLESQKNDSVSEQTQFAQRVERLEAELKTVTTRADTETKKAEQAQAQEQENKVAFEQTLARALEQARQEMKQETQNYKFELDLKYSTQYQNKENEMRQSFTTNQQKDQEIVKVQQSEIQELRLQLQKQKQARQIALMNVQGQVRLLKQEHQTLTESIKKEMTWKRVGPKIALISTLADQVKSISQERAALLQHKQESNELKEQLSEYKGLTQQLQEEKRSLNQRLHENLAFVETAKASNTEIIESLNAQLQTSQTELAEAHQMLTQHKAIAEETIQKLNEAKVAQFQRVGEEHRALIERLQGESDQLRQQRAELQNELLKYKSKTSEQSTLLITSKETITSMVSKENQLMTDLKRKITELGEQQELYKARVTQSKQEKEAIVSKYETLKKENENLRELITIKDGQIEDSRGYEKERRGERERLYGEVRKLKEMLQKRENEIKEIVLTLKAFADEKKRLEKEVERMRNSEMSIGHSNQAQKIQHHLRIKEENNKLKEENFALQDQVRKLMASGSVAAGSGNSNNGVINPGAMGNNATFGNMANEAIQSQQHLVEIEKSRKELTGLHESVARLAETLLKMPGVGQFVGSNDQLATHFKKHPIPDQPNMSTSSATYYANQKLRGTSEVIVQICKQLQARVQECNQMTQEFKRMEQEIQQLQIEKNVMLQANPQLAQQLARIKPQATVKSQSSNSGSAGGLSTQQPAQHQYSNSQAQAAASSMQPSFQVQQPGVQRANTQAQLNSRAYKRM